MKRLLFLPLLTVVLTITAQNEKNAKEIELKEVTVQGARMVQRTDGLWLYPTRQQIAGSTNGYSLLSKLALPHLRIDPTMHTITALSNTGSVQVRINDMIASQEDLLSLDVRTVERVEYLDNPGVRYGENIAYVVNFMVKKPVSGYVIGSDLTNTLTTVNGNETVYGKVNSGKSELGASYSLKYQNFKGIEYKEHATYELESGESRQIHRQQLEGQNKSLRHQTQLTYNLSDSDYVFQTKLSLQRDISPHRDYSRMQTGNGIYDEHSSSCTTSPVLDLYLHRDFAHQQSLTANVVGTYIDSDQYAERNEGGDYHYTVQGQTYSLWGEAIYENRLKPFTLSAGIQYEQKNVHNRYVGDTEALNDMRSSGIYLFGQLKGHLGKLGYMAGLGASTRYYRQGTNDQRFWLFRPKLTVAYPLMSGLKVKYDFEVSQHVSQIALVSDVSIKQNALETLVGNPDIRPNRVMAHDLRLTYSTPRLTTELQGYYRLNANCNMERYTRRDGHFYQTQTNADNSCSFFFIQDYNRWDVVPEILSATIYGGLYRFFNFTDDYCHTYTTFNGGAGLEAYLGQWTLTADVDNGWNFMEGEHRGHQAPAWYFTASYRLSQLTLSLYVQHPFCKRPLSNKAEVFNRYIRKEITMHNRDFGNMITFNLSWTISSGRKYRDIQRTMNHRDTDTGILQND